MPNVTFIEAYLELERKKIKNVTMIEGIKCIMLLTSLGDATSQTGVSVTYR